nr:2OG-Fe(II) oxygenase [Pandoraea pulmonicola]
MDNALPKLEKLRSQESESSDMPALEGAIILAGGLVAGHKALSALERRIATLVIYLKEPECGGGTVFPMAPLEIYPRRGSGIFFAHPDPKTHRSKRTFHGGSPVIKGSKWVATKWLRIGKSEENENNG